MGYTGPARGLLLPVLVMKGIQGALVAVVEYENEVLCRTFTLRVFIESRVITRITRLLNI